MIPPLPNLEDYNISPVNGFLPDHVPLTRLPSSYYEPWELVMAKLNTLIASQQIRRAVERLPLLSVDQLKSEPEWQRAYLVLSFLTHAYVWGEKTPKDRLPRCISVPYLAVSAHLELPPVATYAAVCLWNYRPIFDKDALDVVENLGILNSFTATPDEAWFYLISVAIEARGAPTIPLMIEAMDAARRDDAITVTECLSAFALRLYDTQELLVRMYENCAPEVFYFKIRPFLAGSKNMSDAGLPRGLQYELEDGSVEFRQYSGGSNAQSSLIQVFDIVLGVEHRPTGVKKDPNAERLPGAAPPSKHNFLEEMRSYMPGPHRRFLEHLTTVANIKEYVEDRPKDVQLSAAYDECIRALASFRDKHLQIVSRYLIIQAQQAKKKAAQAASPSKMTQLLGQNATNLLTSASNAALGLAKSEATAKGLKGTGGTQLIPFLKQSRDETLEQATGTWSKTTSQFESFKARRTPKLMLTPPATPRTRSPDPFDSWNCRSNDIDEVPTSRVGVGMAGDWDEDDCGGLCGF